jgi:hypothetical protein
MRAYREFVAALLILLLSFTIQNRGHVLAAFDAAPQVAGSTSPPANPPSSGSMPAIPPAADPCPQCEPERKAVADAEKALAELRRQQAEIGQQQAANKAAQQAAEAQVAALEARLKAQEGLGGSSRNPDPGLTTTATAQADGTVLIIVTNDADKEVARDSRDQRDRLEILRELEAARAALVKLKAEAEALYLQWLRLNNRLSEARQVLELAQRRLALCLEQCQRELTGDTRVFINGVPVPGIGHPPLDPPTTETPAISTPQSSTPPCPQCEPHQQAVADAERALAALQQQQAEVVNQQQSNKAAQEAAKVWLEELAARLEAAMSFGDTEGRAQLEQARADTNAKMEKLKAEAEALYLAWLRLNNRLSEARQALQLAQRRLEACLEQCKHELTGDTRVFINGVPVPGIGHAPPPTPPAPPSVPTTASTTPPCPECEPERKAVAEAEKALAELQQQQAEVTKEQAANKAAQQAAEQRLQELEARMKTGAGANVSLNNPATGLTTMIAVDGDGRIRTSVTDTTGKVVKEDVRDRPNRAEIEQQQAAIDADLAKLKAEADALYLQWLRLNNRLNEARQVLALARARLERCLERCKRALTADNRVFINGVPVEMTDGTVDLVSQLEIIERTETRQGYGIVPHGSPWATLRWFLGTLSQRSALASHASVARNGSAHRVRPNDIFALAQKSGVNDVTGLTLSVVATGNSSGDVFRIRAVDRSGKEVPIDLPDGLVMQPLKRKIQNGSDIVRGREPGQPIVGYCLEFAKLPPTTGALYRVADTKIQQQFAPMTRVLAAVRKLAASGGLHPDTDPAAYLDSMKQWSVWTRLEKWDLASFERHFVEHTRKNAESKKVSWTKEIEAKVRKLVPNRWRDLTAVWAEADATTAGR